MLTLKNINIYIYTYLFHFMKVGIKYYSLGLQM